MFTAQEIETMAQLAHADYLELQAALAADGVDISGRPANRPWSELTPELRAQNRDQVRDIGDKLAAVGLAIVRRRESSSFEPEPLPPEVTLTLARREHERWAEHKRSQGFRYGPEIVDVPPDRRHPDLVPWDELDKAARDKDLNPIERIPWILAAIGCEVIPAP